MKQKKFIALLVAIAALTSVSPAMASRYIGTSATYNAPSIGIVDTLVVPIQFPDAPIGSYAVAKMPEYYYGKNGLSEYFLKQSQGKLQLKGEVLPVYTAEYASEHYDFEHYKCIDVVKEALRYYEQQGIDFSQYDSNQDGTIDHVFAKFSKVWYRGHDHVASPFIVSEIEFTHTSCSRENTVIGDEGDRIIDYHEFGHTLGLHDYYNWKNPGTHTTDELMYGVWDTYINVYEKYMLEWIEPVIVSGQGLQEITVSRQELEQPEHPQAIIIIPDDSLLPFSEYYMVEYRQYNSVCVWRLDTEVYDKSGGYKAWDKSPPAHHLNEVKLNSETGVVLSQDTYPAGDFCNNVFAGTYIEVLEKTEDTVTLRVGIEEDNGKAPILQKTSFSPDNLVSIDRTNVVFTFDTAIQAEGQSILENVSTGEQCEIDTTINGNVLTADLKNKLEEDTEYRLSIPLLSDPAGNVAEAVPISFRTMSSLEEKNQQRQRWELKEVQEAETAPEISVNTHGLSWQENQLSFGKTALGEMEFSENMTVWTQPSGCSVILSQRNSSWLGYSYPVLSKVSKDGDLLWQMEYDGLGEAAEILPSDLSQHCVYVQTESGVKRLSFYEDGEEGAEVTINYQPGRYRMPIQDVTLSAPEGYSVLYTLDGSDPRFYGVPYTAPLAFPRSCELRAVPVKDEVFGHEFAGNYYFTQDSGQPWLYCFNANSSIASANDGSFQTAEKYQGDYEAKNYDFSDFQNITGVAVDQIVVGVRTDGTLIATGNIADFTGYEGGAEEFEAECAKVREAVQIDGGLSTVLKRDGTIENWWLYWEWDASLVQDYHDVVKIAGNDVRMFFLHEDGTVTYADKDSDTVVDIAWKDIVDIHYNGDAIGLDKNGTVWYWEKKTGETHRIWENMKNIRYMNDVLVGITTTGKAVRLSELYGSYDECLQATKILFDEPVIDVLWGDSRGTVGLRSDGTLIVERSRGQDVLETADFNLLPKRRVDIVPETVEMECGTQQRLPLDFDWIDRKTVEWESDNVGIVTVDSSGMLKALRPGTATVTAHSTVDNTAVDTVTVTVKDDGLDHGPVVETNTEGKIQVTVKSNAYNGEAYVLAGYSRNGKCIGTKVIPVTLTGGETASVEVPIIANCDAVCLYTWTKNMQPLSYPSVVPIISSIGG